MSNSIQQKPLNIVAVSGGLNNPSKTEALVQAIIDELGEATPINVHFIKFSEIGQLLGGAIYRNQLPQRVQDDLAAVEAADALIVGTPVYRASFTGLFKHFFDFVEQTALVDVPVLLAASGGSERHALWAPAKGQRAEAIKEKSQQANQNLGINKQIEQEDVLPSAAVPTLDAAEARLHHKKPKTHVA